MRPDRFAGKVALVTGAGSGIGERIALDLAAEGATVVAHGPPDADDPARTVARIAAAGGSAHAVRGDLGDPSACRAVVDEAVAAAGALDLLVNNAGVTIVAGFHETSAEMWDLAGDVNARAPYLVSQRALERFRDPSAAAIVNVSSIHASAGHSGYSAYAASKGALEAMTRVLATELAATGVRVNAVAPGLIETTKYFDDPGYTTALGASIVPLRRVGRPEDVSAAVRFLLSEESAFITGQVLAVDGGASARASAWMWAPLPDG